MATGLALLAMAIGLASLPGPPAQAGDQTILRGRVVDHRGLDVHGVAVRAYHRVDGAWVVAARTTTGVSQDDRGFFAFEGLPPGKYRLGFEPGPLYVPEFYGDAASVEDATDVSLPAGGEVDLQEDLFPSTQMSGRVTGRLGNGLSSISVRVYRMKDGAWVVDEGNYASTGPEGRYRIGTTHPGPYRLSFSSPSYSDEFWPDAWDILDAHDIHLPLYSTREGLDVDLDPPGRVTGRIVSDTFAGGIHYPEVLLWRFKAGVFRQDEEVRGDYEGRFTFEQLDPGRYRLHVADEHMYHHGEFWDDALNLERATDILVRPGAATPIGEMEIEWAAPLTRFLKPPKITGEARVGEELRAERAGWLSWSGKWTYQWMADGKPIKGATTLRYSPTAAVVGKLITFVETQYQSYKMPTPAKSSPVRARLGVLHNRVPPKLVGEPEVGSRLAVRPGEWSPSRVSLTYRWFAGERRITGADDRVLMISPEHRGRQISVKVTATRPGYRSVVFRLEAS